MRIEATQQTTTARVTGAIQQAAKATGTSFQYLLATAKVESNLNPNAMAKTSSAGGLFQFIEQTWLGTMKEAGASLGYGRYANAVTRGESGRYSVADPALKAEILKLRQDPTANALMAGALTKSNAALLSQKLGRPPSDGELYMAHFLGVKGATKLIGQSEQQPGTSAVSAFPGAARANRSIFFNKDGRPRNVAEVSAELSGRFQVAKAHAPARAPALSIPTAVAQVDHMSSARTARPVLSRNPLAIPAANSVPPAVATRLAAIAPASPSRAVAAAAAVAPPAEARPIQVADDVAPTANARVARAYEVLSPNMVRSLSAPVPPVLPTVAPQPAAMPAVNPAVNPVVNPAMAPVTARQRRASIEGEPMFSNPYRAAERRQAIAPAVKDLWTEASANVARARALSGGTPAPNATAETRRPLQRVASVAPAAIRTDPTPQRQVVAAVTPAAASASAEPLGLFQDVKPNVRALFTGG